MVAHNQDSLPAGKERESQMSSFAGLLTHNLVFTSLAYLGAGYIGYGLFKLLTRFFKTMALVTRVTIAVIVAAFFVFIVSSPLLAIAGTGTFILGSPKFMLFLTALHFTLIAVGLVHIIHWIFALKNWLALHLSPRKN